ncbi:MAG: GNAT family N-acetyltransferase [Brevefilum sp.]|nr:GNAT family N-acetyltransferase [Brevefilum sp.]
MLEIKLINKDEFGVYLDGVMDLYNGIFKNKVNQEYFLWRYLYNPFDELLMVLALDQGRVISNYSAVPLFLEHNDSKYKSGLSIHTMTHKNFRGMGLFAKTGDLLYQHLKSEGYKIIFGFPNASIHRALNKKLKRVDIYEFPTMSLDMQKVKNKPIEIITDDDFLLSYNFVHKDKSKISVHKDLDYMRWRYSKCPTVKYHNLIVKQNDSVTSFFVIKKYDNKINIVDYFINNQADFDELFAQVLTYAHDQKADQVTTWANINTDLKLWLEKNGFSNSLPITYFSGKILDDNCSLNYHINNWQIVMGDDNVY